MLEDRCEAAVTSMDSPAEAPSREDLCHGVEPTRNAIRTGERSAAEVLDRVEDRWQQTHGWLNALVQPRFQRAAAEAAKIQRGDLRPLAGVPVSVKDCFSIDGLSTTLGVLPRRHLQDERDCLLVRQLRESGAVIVGKANVPQALYLHETDNPVFGQTVNPLNRSRGPGGSSGGDAALVAAGVVPVAFGNDLAGSIRQPAHACGLVGYLPSSRCLGSGGAVNTMPSLRGFGSRVGVLARSVADARQAIEAVTGRSFRSTPTAGSAIGIGWWETAGPISSSASVARAVREAVAAVSAAGMMPRQVDDSFAELAGWLHLGLVSSDGGASIRKLLEGSPPIQQVAELFRLAGVPRWQRPLLAAFASVTGRAIEAVAVRKTGPRSPRELEQLLQARESLWQLLDGWRGVQGIDAAIFPVSALPALRHGTAARLILAAFPCLMASLFDLPAASLPVTRVLSAEMGGRAHSRDPVVRAANATDAGSEGLPIGVQVVALDGREETLLRVMQMIEDGVRFC